MSIESTIDEIVEKGTQVNQRLDQKIKALEQHNTAFRTTLINKLQIISEAIDNFKQTNLQGLTETKNDLDEARRQLQETQAELDRTRAELEEVKRQFTDINNRLTATNQEKTNLDAKIAQLEQIIRDMETDCNNKISGVRKEMADKSTQEKKQMVQEQEEIKRVSDAQIAELNKNIEELRRQSEDAQRGQENAKNELRTLQENQERLLVKLGTVNQMLTSQLEMIDKNIDLNNPNYGDYEGLLDTIQAGLGGVISGINSAVSSTTGSSSSGPQSSGPPGSYSDKDVEQNYNNLLTLKKSFNDITSLRIYLSKYMKCKQISQNQKDILSDRLSQVFASSYKEEAIKTYLKDYEVFIPEPGISGGKRKCKRKTMKKIPLKSRKYMKKYQKGGYLYKKDKNLNNASTDVSNLSNSSNSSSGTNSNTNRKSKKGYKRPRSRTKRRSRK